MPTKKKQVSVVLSGFQEYQLRDLSDLYGFSMSKIMGKALDFYCSRIDHYHGKGKKPWPTKSANNNDR